MAVLLILQSEVVSSIFFGLKMAQHWGTFHGMVSPKIRVYTYFLYEGIWINKYIKKLRYLGVRYLSEHAWRDSNPQPSVPKTDALSN